MALKPLWILIAAGFAAAVYVARSSGKLLRGVLVVLGVLAFLVGIDVLHPPSVEHVVTQVGGRLGDWTYLLVGVNAFLETGAFLGFVAPGETMVLFGGVLAGEGTIDLATLIVITWLCAMAGDVSAYAIGRRYGRAFLIRHGARVKVGEPQVQFVEGFFTRHGKLTILLGRWVGVVRPLLPFLAGSSRMRFWEFLVIDLIATAIWATGLSVLGSIFWHNFDELVSLVGRTLFAVGTLIAVAVITAIAVSAHRDPARRAHVEHWLSTQRVERPWLARPAAGVWGFVGRIEPRMPGQPEARAADPAGTVAADGRGEHSPADPE